MFENTTHVTSVENTRHVAIGFTLEHVHYDTRCSEVEYERILKRAKGNILESVQQQPPILSF